MIVIHPDEPKKQYKVKTTNNHVHLEPITPDDVKWKIIQNEQYKEYIALDVAKERYPEWFL